jgi:hypothetical protein
MDFRSTAFPGSLPPCVNAGFILKCTRSSARCISPWIMEDMIKAVIF